MRRLLSALVLAAALASCGSEGHPPPKPAATSPQPAPQPRPSDASVFVAEDGSDKRSCRSPQRACASFQRAYRAARAGEVVEVAAGIYAEQQVRVDRRKRARRHVVFRPAAGAEVTVAALTLGSGEAPDGPRHVTFEGLRTAYASETQQRPVSVLPGTRDVILRHLDAGNFVAWGVRGLKIVGGDWGPCAIEPGAPCNNSRIDSGPRGTPTRDVLVDGARFHDYRFAPSCYEDGADCHFECLYVNGSRDVTIRGSRFRDCALFDIFATISGPDGMRAGHRGLTIENNWFDTPWDESGLETAQRARASAIALSWCESSPQGYRDVRIRFNSFHDNTGLMIEPGSACVFEDVRIVGNTMAWDGCDPRWSYAYNVYSSAIRRGRCAATDRIAGTSIPYTAGISGERLDMHLTAAAVNVARDRVPATVPGGCPRRDIDGQPRPAGGRCDAGSDEAG
jgi:hypothetical protein